MSVYRDWIVRYPLSRGWGVRENAEEPIRVALWLEEEG